jgi:hypothetical protein
MFARPRAKPLGLNGSGVAWCYHSASTYAQTPCSSYKFEKVGTEEAYLTLPVGLLAFHLASVVEK